MASSSTSQATSQATTSPAASHTVRQERIDAIIPLDTAHPFDLWQHCLWCHVAGLYSGHRADSCPKNGPQDHDPFRGENLDWIREIPRNDHTGPLIDLITQVGILDYHDADFLLHVNRRDALYLKMHQAMINSHGPFGDESIYEIWYRAMSAYSILADVFQRRCMDTCLEAVRRSCRLSMRRREHAFDFLRRTTASAVDVEQLLSDCPPFIQPLENAETALRKVKSQYEELWAKWDNIIQTYLDAPERIQNLDPADTLWIRKAFAVMTQAQPHLDYHSSQVLSWSFPNVDEVACREGLVIPEPAD